MGSRNRKMGSKSRKMFRKRKMVYKNKNNKNKIIRQNLINNILRKKQSFLRDLIQEQKQPISKIPKFLKVELRLENKRK